MDQQAVEIVPEDGSFWIMREEYDDVPDIEESLRGFRVVAFEDFMLVQCIEEDNADSVLLNIIEFDQAPALGIQQVMDGWPHKVHGTWTVAGPSVIASADDAEIAPFLEKPGTYEFIYAASMADPKTWQPGEAREEHQVFIWPEGADDVPPEMIFD